MSLLNIANDGFYNVLIALSRALAFEGPIEKEKLIEICSDKSEQARKRLGQTLLRWTQMGLFIEENEKVKFCDIAEKALKGRKNIDRFTADLPSILRVLIFDAENNKHFWDKEKTKAADLTRGLSWILSQNIYEFSLGNIQKVQQVESKQVIDSEKRPIQNDVRLNGLRSWAKYLGFVFQSKEPMVDPTIAIKQELPRILETRKLYTAEQFLQILVKRLPVLDGGEYRLLVEETLDPQHWEKPAMEDMLSLSLSRALWRLEQQELLEFESRADSLSRRILQRQGGNQLKAFSHVRYQGGPA